MMEEPETKIYNPWNPANRIMPDGEILRVLRMFGIKDKPNNWELFRQACVHCSYVDRPEGPTVANRVVSGDDNRHIQSLVASPALKYDRIHSSPTAIAVGDTTLSSSFSRLVANGEQVVVAPRPPNCLPLQKADNEAIEFVGDSILGCVIAVYLHERYPTQDEGFLTPLRSRLVNNKHLGHLAIRLGFAKWIILSRHVEDLCHGRRNLRILGSMLEAWVGAIYLDLAARDPGKAYDRVRQWLINLYESRVNFCEMIAEDTNFKDQLLKYYQATYHQPPRYKEVAVDGPLHDRTFTMGVLAPNGDVVATATARNKKVAEQEASRLALVRLGAIQEEEPDVAAEEEIKAAEAIDSSYTPVLL